MPTTIHAAFSANAEVTTSRESKHEEKGALFEFDAHFGGGSANTANALSQFGLDTRLMCLAGERRDFARAVFDFAASRVSFPVQTLEVLDKTSVAHYDDDRSHPNRGVTGMRGQILPHKQEFLRQELAKVQIHSSDFVVCNGLLEPEAPFAQILLERTTMGRRIVNPKITFCSSGALLGFLAGKTDLLILNDKEWKTCDTTFGTVHDCGVRCIIVTEGKSGGTYSLDGSSGRFEPLIVDAPQYYTVGAGDWFVAGFLHHLLSLGKSLGTVTRSEFEACLQFAARVAGKKVTMFGVSNGPSLEEI